MLRMWASMAGRERTRVLRCFSSRASRPSSSDISTSRSWATRSTKSYPRSSQVCASRGDIAAAISHIDPLVVLRYPSDLLHTALPDLRFPRPFLALRLCFPSGSEFASEGFLGETPQDLLRLRVHRQHRVQTEANILLAVANWRQSFEWQVALRNQTRSCLPAATSGGTGSLRNRSGSNGESRSPRS